MSAELREVPEIWTGSIFNSSVTVDTENFESSRNGIVEAIKDWYVVNFDDLYSQTGSDLALLDDFESIDIKPVLREATDFNNNQVLDKYKHVIKYLEFVKIPINIKTKNTVIPCEYAIRINICYRNKSKIMAYLHPREDKEYDSATIFAFFQESKKKMDDILKIFGEQYKKESYAEDLNYKINIYNIGTNNELIKKSLAKSNIDFLVKNIKKYPVFQRAFLDVVSVTHGHFFESFENYVSNVKTKHIWTANIDTNDQKTLFTLFAQKFSIDENNRICEYSGLTNSANIKDIHSMDRRLVFSFINEF
jgi:hypothetical protein